MLIKSEMSQQHRSREQHSSWIGLVLALDVQTDVTASRLKDRNVTAHVATRHNTGSTNKRSTNVGENTSVQVRHDHNIELLWSRDTLHGCVVNDHVVGLQGGVVLSHSVEGVSEETIRKLHDVRLVDTGDLLSVVRKSKAERELGDALGLGAGDDLEGLDDAGNRLVLKARVLSLSVLTDDAQVDIVVAGLVARDVLDEDNRGVDVKLLSERNVERLVAGALDGRVEDTLETELVALQRGDSLTEELLGVLVAGLDTGDIDLLPLDGDVVGLEDGLDGLGDFGSDTVTGDEGHGVFAAVLGGLEDISLDGSTSYSMSALS